MKIKKTGLTLILAQKVTQWIESSNIEQHIANRIELSDSQPNDHIFSFNSDESEQLVELLVDDNSPVKKMYQAANEMRHALPKAAKDGALDELCEFIGVNLSEETVEPTYNLKKMLDKVYERYEMLTLLESVNRSWRRPENQVENGKLHQRDWCMQRKIPQNEHCRRLHILRLGSMGSCGRRPMLPVNLWMKKQKS